MANRPTPKRPSPYRKGDLFKQKALGGHLMTVIAVSKDGKNVTGSYTTPDGTRHQEIMRTVDCNIITLA